jgi:hypothetical protein
MAVEEAAQHKALPILLRAVKAVAVTVATSAVKMQAQVEQTLAVDRVREWKA